MGFLEHLEELRMRLIRSCIAIGAGMMIAYAYVEPLETFILGPPRAATPAPPSQHLRLVVAAGVLEHPRRRR